MDLMCWVDIEQFRRMLHKDKEGREEKSKDIKNKYLNKKYFFGPNSPATRQQQEQVPVTKAFIKKLVAVTEMSLSSALLLLFPKLSLQL